MPVDSDEIWSSSEASVLGMVTLRSASLSAGLLDIPNIQACWIPSSTYIGSGAAIQQPEPVGQHVLAVNAGATVNLEQNSKLYEAACWNLASASSQYLSRAHENALVPIAPGNFSFGVWINPTTLPSVGNTMGVIGKGTDAPANRAWLVFFGNLGRADFRVYNAGGVNTDVVSDVVMTTGSWYFIQCRLQGSTEMAIFVNGKKNVNTTSIPAAARNTTSEFSIGRWDAANYLNAKVGAAYLSGSVLSDKTMIAIYNRTRIFYGV